MMPDAALPVVMQKKRKQVPLWEPHAGPQTMAYYSPCSEVLFGGARGGGKTATCLAKFLPYLAYGLNATGVIFRRTYPELEEVIRQGKEIFKSLARWNGQTRTFEFIGGASLKLRYLRRLADCDNYQGHAYCYMGLDEFGVFSDFEIYEKLKACLRCKHREIPLQMFFTANPGGRLHNEIKAHWHIGEYPEGGEIIYDEAGRSKVYFPAKLEDNPSLAGTEYEATLRSISDPELRKAWLDGSWDVMLGTFFGDIWRSSLHTFKANQVPPEWTIFRSFDWGSAKPFCVLWWAMADGVERCGGKVFPRGTIVVFREWYGAAKGKNDCGIRMSNDDIGKGIIDMERFMFPNNQVKAGPADTSIFSEQGGPSIYNQICEGAMKPGLFVPANKVRVAGWQAIRNRLDPRQDGGPRIVFDVSCENAIRTIPALVRDPKNPEDIEDKQEDHAPDTVRYVCAAFLPKPKYAKDIDSGDNGVIGNRILDPCS